MTTGLRARARATRERPHTRAHARTRPTMRWRRRALRRPEHTLPRPHVRRRTRGGRARARARVRTFPRRGRTAVNGARASASFPDAHACLGAKGRRSASASGTPAGDSRGAAIGVGRRSLGGPAAGSMRAGSVRRAPVMRRAAWRSADAGAFARAPASLCVRGPADEYVRMCCRSAVGAGASYAPGGALARRSRATVPAAAVADVSDVAAEPPPSAPKSEPSVSLSHLVCSSIDALRKSSTCLRSLDTVEVPSSSSRAQPMAAPAGNVKCDGEEAHVCVRARVRVVSVPRQRRARRGVAASHARRHRPTHSFHASRAASRARGASRSSTSGISQPKLIVTAAGVLLLVVPATRVWCQHCLQQRNITSRRGRTMKSKDGAWAPRREGAKLEAHASLRAYRCGGGNPRGRGGRTHGGSARRRSRASAAAAAAAPLSRARTSRPRPGSRQRAASEAREGE